MATQRAPTVLAPPASGAVWFTSDLHLGHANIIEYCKRPFASIDAMNEALVANWNSRVRPEDTVFCLGDFGLGRPEDVIALRKRMNGAVTLLRGNHDRFGKSRAVELNVQVIEGDAELTLGATTFHLSHYPRLLAEKLPGRTHLFGHVHEKFKVRDGMLNIGVDVWDFRPITPDEALAALKE